MNENGTSYVLPIFLCRHCIMSREHGLKYMKGTEANGSKSSFVTKIDFQIVLVWLKKNVAMKSSFTLLIPNLENKFPNFHSHA